MQIGWNPRCLIWTKIPLASRSVKKTNKPKKLLIELVLQSETLKQNYYLVNKYQP